MLTKAAAVAQQDLEFEVVLQVTKQQVASKPSSKRKKVEPLTVGPFNVKFSSSWDEFLSIVARALASSPSDLKVNTFSWKFQKPRNSSALPLVDVAGYASLVKKLGMKVEPYIFLLMDAPELSEATTTVRTHYI